ncbi:MAG: HlyD family efflux transporter periplasmic adaptor subunit [Verrucomicrobiota bacterium]|mgnify:FL=1
MVTEPIKPEETINRSLADLGRLRRFTGSPSEFWPTFLAAAATLAQATKGALILRDPNQPETWKKLGDWSSNGHADRSIVTFTRALGEIAERCSKEGNFVQVIENSATPTLKHFAVAVRLQLNKPEELCVAAFLLLNVTEQQAGEALVRLRLVSDTPFSYLLNFASNQAKADVEKFAASLDVMVLLNSEKRFLAAALAFCNALATRYNCDRVSLGWLENGYIRLRAISRTERFDRNMAAVKALETAMEESFDQDDEILWPAAEGASVVSRDHEAFAREQGAGHLCSLPVRLEGKPLAVLTCERQGRHFTVSELQQIRLCCDQAARRLSDLKREDRWWGARLATAAREKLAQHLGPEHTWAKVLAITIVLVLAILFFVPFNYRVEGKFILRSDDVSFLTGPFDGYINEVLVRPGDQVNSNGVLLKLDTDDLMLEQAAALADQTRYLREAQKAEVTKALAEKQIALALADQSKARLDLVQHRLDQASIRTPFKGVVVEGDLRERIGAPVKQGEALFKVARMDSLYVEAEVNQRDIHEILGTSKGEIAFVTQPRLKFPVGIERIEPAAFPKEGENVFIVRCALTKAPESWWHPGMSGLVKLEAGKRTLFWILTHRTVDFLRLFLWW